MDFREWEPIYMEILKDFGWQRRKDEESAKLLANLLHGKTIELEDIKEKINGKNIIVCGKADTLPDDLENIDRTEYIIIAADGATSTLLEKSIVPDIIVTDLDGYLPDEIIANRKGAIMVVHAHGDNMDKLSVVEKLNNVIGTTQSVPFDNINNFGGLSDGDRCVFLAHEFGAKSIKLAGFNLEDKNVTGIKKKKLKWAQKLIKMIPGVIRSIDKSEKDNYFKP
ncbi:MAG: DUF115 domain-containing protein [Candidatus Methanoperedens sp.]|nr:DUF115 domain-containing protein [Candidatus Methanoperedens sp.]MCE8426685.1 DUF115 domain-containing protein [Candidatus Methanoperedens sp.]MCE8429683.1 DUF115 domain-containing protein [Candidatus Methanoperedens sp.]